MKKTSISLAERTLSYVDEKAEEIGVNRSAMISFMIESYRKQEENMKVMSKENIDFISQLIERENASEA